MAGAADRTTKPRSFDELWIELDRVPEGCIGEIVNGEIVETQRPDAPHIAASTDLTILLGGPFRLGQGGPGGWVILAEPRIRFSSLVRVPDLAGWRTERFVAPESGPYVVMPDWICEVLSPGTVRIDRTEKMPLYAGHGVGHLWLLEPVVQTLEVYRLQAGSWVSVATYGGDAKVRAEPFDAVEIDLTLVWGPKREPIAR